jgi:endoglucanase
MFKKLSLSIIIFGLISSLAQGQASNNIRLNQVGFYTNGPKVAVAINSTATTFSITSPDRNTTYFNGTLSTAKYWAQSGENAKTATFTSFNTPGTYVVVIPGLGHSYPFNINDEIYKPLNQSLLKAYYNNRSSTATLATHSGIYARGFGHPDNQVVIHPSAAGPGRPAGSTVSSPKGWYDAGDYNCYIVNSGISTYELMITYEHFSEYYDNLNLNIPESKNTTPDILDEIRWNLDWMLTMQDPGDGGVYFKKTNANFDDYVMPSAATETRYMVGKTTSSAFDFAATMAVAYRIYLPFDLAFANTCLAAAKNAFTWGINNNNVQFTNPIKIGTYPPIVTGEYGDDNLADERDWASNELYISTKTASYYATGFTNTKLYDVPSWQSVSTLGLISLVNNRKNLDALGSKDTTNMKSKLLGLANALLTYQKNNSPYKIAQGQGGDFDFPWGSNAVAGNQGIILINAYRLTNNREYLDAAMSNLDYLLGRNATGFSFITGFGDKNVFTIHHRPSLADNIVAPQPGWVVGGPTGPQADGCDANSTFLAKSFEDADCYSKTEVTINWNSPAVYLSSFLAVYANDLPARRPFNNSPIAIPGTIEAENYDIGGQNVSYNDTEIINRGLSNYRADAVDIESDGVGRHTVGYFEDGEWLEYTVNIAKADYYQFTFRVANGLKPGSLNLELDGTPLLATTIVPNTGSWTTYANLIKTISLPQGVHVLRLNIEKAAFNFDNINVIIDPLSSNNKVEEINRVNVFPNPSETGLFKLSQVSAWEVFCLHGLKLAEGTSQEIDLSAKPKGMYLIKTENNQLTKVTIE